MEQAVRVAGSAFGARVGPEKAEVEAGTTESLAGRPSSLSLPVPPSHLSLPPSFPLPCGVPALHLDATIVRELYLYTSLPLFLSTSCDRW